MQDESSACDLVDRIRRGDSEGMRELAERYRDELCRTIAIRLRQLNHRKRGGDGTEAAFRSEIVSVFNDTILRFVCRIRAGELQLTQREVVSYLVRIAMNLLSSQRRDYARMAASFEEDPAEIASDAPSAAQIAELRDLAAKYRSLATALPAVSQRVLEMRIEQGLSFAAIGEQLCIPENAARRRFSESLARLRKLGAELDLG